MTTDYRAPYAGLGYQVPAPTKTKIAPPLSSDPQDTSPTKDFSDADDAVAQCVRPRRLIEPEWDYSDGYRRFRRLYPTLRPLEEP